MSLNYKTFRVDENAPRVVRTFQEKCQVADRSALEAGVEYYDALSEKQKREFREYALNGGHSYIQNFTTLVQSWHSSGMADRMGQFMLKSWASGLLATAERERDEGIARKSYLNAEGDRKT